MAELTSSGSLTSNALPDAERTRPEAAPARRRLVQVGAECVRQAHEHLGLLDQVDVEVGSSRPARQLLRTRMLERIARCEALAERRHRLTLSRRRIAVRRALRLSGSGGACCAPAG